MGESLPPTIRNVQMDSLVVMKIIKHSEDDRRSGTGELAQGYITGLIAGEDHRLEVTQCFPMPKLMHDDEEENVLVSHQEEMLKKFRTINYDYLLVGFYQSTPFGACFTEAFVESVFDYQSNEKNSVVLVYDPVKTTQGIISIRAFRLSQQAMKLCYKDFSPDSIKRSGLTYEKLFEELPVTIKNSQLVNIMLCELELQRKDPVKAPFLDLGSNGNLERSLRMVMSQMDSLNTEINRYNRYQGAKQKQDQMKENHQQKRNQENEARRQRGEHPLPEDDLTKLFKPLQPPSMLDGLLASAEIGAHVDHALKVAAQNLGKLFMAEAMMQKK